MRKDEKPIRINNIRVNYVKNYPTYQVMLELCRKARRVRGYPYETLIPVFNATDFVAGDPRASHSITSKVDYVKNSITLLRSRGDYYLGVF